jgi:uncharacterized protein with HEPN domain
VKRTQVVRLRDMLESIDAVAEMTMSVDFGGYGRGMKLRRAVEPCIEIVSEASRHIPPSLKDRFSEQPWPEIAAIGNLLRHDYQRVDDLIIWKIAKRSLPQLRPTIVAMIKAAETDENQGP